MSHSDEQLDELLKDSGDRWRATEPEPPRVDVASLVRQHPTSGVLPMRGGAWAAVAIVAAISVAAIYFTGPIGPPARSNAPSPLSSLTSHASTTPGPQSTASSPARTPSPNPALAACSAKLDRIDFVRSFSGSPTITAAYRVTGRQLASYFNSVLDQNGSNGTDWWDSPTKIVDMCVYDGDFETMTPGPSGHDTNATRILVVIDGNDAMAWAFCFKSQTSCGITTTDPALLAMAPSVAPTASPPASTALGDGCGPSDLQPFFTVQPTPGNQYGWPLPDVIRDSGKVVTVDEAQAAYPDLLQPTSLPADLSLQLVLLPPKGSSRNDVELFYAAEPIADEETDWDFHRARAIFLAQGPTHGQTAQFIEEAMGGQFLERGRIVRVGPFYAAVVHDITYETGDDTYRIYWSDGTTDYWIVASTQPSEAVDVARSMYCASELPTPAPASSTSVH